MWTLDKIHKVGELVAALAVVLSLLFVGYEIQQSNQAQLQANTRAVIGEWIQKLRSMNEAPELACIYVNGIVDYLGMSGARRVRFSAYILSIMYAWEEIHYLASQGAVEERIWRGVDSGISEISHLPGFQQWYATRRHWFSDEFQTYIDESIRDAPFAEPLIFADETCWHDNGDRNN